MRQHLYKYAEHYLAVGLIIVVIALIATIVWAEKHRKPETIATCPKCGTVIGRLIK